MAWEDDVGTAGDAVIARRHGVPIAWVKVEREKRGLSPLPSAALLDWAKVAELGQMTDREVATRYGVPQRTVQAARIRLGIPAFRGAP